MSNVPYVSKRLMQMIPVLIGITVVTFLVIRLVPGNPALVMLGPKKATPDAIAAINHQLGLDQPLPIQYVVFLKNLAHGNLGMSFFFQESVLQLVWEKVPATLIMAPVAIRASTLYVGKPDMLRETGTGQGAVPH